MTSTAVVFLLSLGLFTLGSPAFAVKSLDFTIHQEYLSTRAAGMGNAFTAVVDDHSSLFYNPAAMALREDGHIRMFLRAGIDDQIMPLTKDLDGFGDKTPLEASAFIESKYGSHYHSRLPTLGAMWVRPNWGVAFIPADFSLDIGVHRQVGPMLNVNGYLDSTLAYGYAREFKWFGKNNRFAMGATLKAVHRAHVGETIIAATLVDDQELFDLSRANEGLTFDMDIGTLYKPMVGARAFIKPTFALVMRNIVDYGFTTNFHIIDKNSGEPPKLQRRVDFGTKLDLPKFWVFDPHMSVDIRDMLHSNWSLRKGLHVGAELYWKMRNWWKGHWALGLNQGYWTAGFGARMAIFQLDIASYGEEVGSTSAPIESRRYMVEMSLDF